MFFEYVCEGGWCYFLTGNVCQGVARSIAPRQLEKYPRDDSLLSLPTLNKVCGSGVHPNSLNSSCFHCFPRIVSPSFP